MEEGVEPLGGSPDFFAGLQRVEEGAVLDLGPDHDGRRDLAVLPPPLDARCRPQQRLDFPGARLTAEPD